MTSVRVLLLIASLLVLPFNITHFYLLQSLDVIGVCKTAEDVSRITTRSSREVSKRTLHLIDATGKMVAATLWGEEVVMMNETLF